LTISTLHFLANSSSSDIDNVMKNTLLSHWL
jgi:hypothetical protein